MDSTEIHGNIRVTWCTVEFDHGIIPVYSKAIITLWEDSSRNEKTKDLGPKLPQYLCVFRGHSFTVFITVPVI
jgi:hypothetical protein